PPMTRGIVIPSPSETADRNLIDDLRQRPATRAITIEERTKVAEIAAKKPSIDLDVTFDSNSATITAKAVPTLVNLGVALRDPQLKGMVFLLGGHTDAKGADDYNLGLSERRSQA